MWGLQEPVVWQPWPGAADALPDVHLATVLCAHPELIILLGADDAGPRGRFGLVGLPGKVQPLAPSLAGLTAPFTNLPRDTLRLALLTYDLGAVAVALPAPVTPTPPGFMVDLAAFALVDHRLRQVAVVGPDAAARRLLQHALAAPTPTAPAAGRGRFEPMTDDAAHTTRLRRVLEHIAAGDIYQANISRRLVLNGHIDGIGLLLRLAQRNPVAHAAYVRLQGVELLSNSMETLATYDPATRRLESFPIKGTCARSDTPGHSDLAAHGLVADPKERAEHVMIVDLVRNDLGKICVPGSVEVPRLMGAEPYRGVWHGVSTVRGNLAAERTCADVVTALFPGGSITGAPKRRAMQIIAALEAAPRGFYTGSLALIAPDGRLSMSILIRTLVRDGGRDGADWHLAVGGGIVADSLPARELCETWEKAEVFRQVLG